MSIKFNQWRGEGMDEREGYRYIFSSKLCKFKSVLKKKSAPVCLEVLYYVIIYCFCFLLGKLSIYPMICPGLCIAALVGTFPTQESWVKTPVGGMMMAIMAVFHLSQNLM